MIISQTPLRVSLLGGGTDQPEWYSQHDGYVIGSTIDKYVYVIVSKRFDDKIVVGYSKQEEVNNVTEIQHDLVREAAILSGMTKGFEVKTLSDIPSGGSGLGSSSAILVGLLNAFGVYKNVNLTNIELATRAYYIERHVLERSVGQQDHYFAAVGGQKLFKFSIPITEMKPVNITTDNLYLFYTGITRSAFTLLSEQMKNVNKNTEVDYQSLATMARSLTNFTNYHKFLPMYLNEAWEIKKRLSPNATNPDIDDMCSKADSGGAEGYKILGAGGGGFLLVYCRHENIDMLRRTMKDYRELPFRFVDYGSRIVFNND
jgi:D-glycero-alpha-D-manno-heptose-7-phosphate kinase